MKLKLIFMVPTSQRFIPDPVIMEWARRLDAMLGDLHGRVYVSDLHRTLELPNVARNSVVIAMCRLGWDGPTRVLGGDRTRVAYVKGTSEERRRVIYLYRDPITRALYAGHTPP